MYIPWVDIVLDKAGLFQKNHQESCLFNKDQLTPSNSQKVTYTKDFVQMVLSFAVLISQTIISDQSFNKSFRKYKRKLHFSSFSCNTRGMQLGTVFVHMLKISLK